MSFLELNKGDAFTIELACNCYIATMNSMNVNTCKFMQEIMFKNLVVDKTSKLELLARKLVAYQERIASVYIILNKLNYNQRIL